MVTTNDEIDNIKEELRKNLTQDSNGKGKSNDNNNNQRMNSFRYPAILLIGDTGVGKSTLGNWLLGHHGDDGPFETQASFDRVTLEPQTALIEINGCKYNLIDTPGLFDLKDDSRSEISLTKLANTINHCSYGIQTIIFVVKKSFGKEIDRQIQAIKGFLGEKSLDHMLIAFTHCNMEQTMDRIIMKETFTSKMKNFLDYIDNRWIISPNPDLFNLDDDIVYTNIYEAKDIIGSFPEAYTTEMFNRVRRAREDAEEAARRHAQEERLRSCEEELARIRGEVDKAGRLKANEEARKACFSLDTIVTLKDGRKIEMSEVKIGDHVACGVYNNGGIKEIRYSEVYLIAHLDKHQQTEFLKVEYIKPDGMTGSLYLTSEHHVFVDNAFDYARNIRPHASQIHVLDNGESISVKVTNVSKETREGYIAIFTRVGTIIANNVLCSCYSNCPPYQNTIHYILSPLRFITLFRKSNHYSNEIHPYLKFLYNNYQYFSGTFKHKLC